MNAEGKAMMQKSMADLNVLKLNKGYTWNSGEWGEETKILTRLTEEETVPVALAVFESGRLKPYADIERHDWAMGTVKLPEREWKKAFPQIPADLKQKSEDLKAE